jgi:hypothetical protein
MPTQLRILVTEDSHLKRMKRKYVTGYYCMVVLHKASLALQLFVDVLCIPISVLITLDSSTSALWLQQRHLVAKEGVDKKYPWM